LFTLRGSLEENVVGPAAVATRKHPQSIQFAASVR
jgi:hypothetical protein